MLKNVSSSELTEWMAFWNLSPQGEQRGDIRNALLMNLVAKIAGSKQSKPTDFLPFNYEEQRRTARLTPYQQSMKLKEQFIRAGFDVIEPQDGSTKTLSD